MAGTGQVSWRRRRSEINPSTQARPVHGTGFLTDEQGVVSYRVPSKGTGLPLDSTATQHIFADVLLWLHGPRHQGQLTSAPFLSSLAGEEAFAW